MLTSLVVGPLWVRIVFRSTSNTGEVVRAIDLSWEEIRELQDQLALTLGEHTERPAEEDSRWDLSC